MLPQNILRNLQFPMEQRLPYHWAHPGILHVPKSPRRKYLIAQLRSEPSLGPRALQPPSDLSLIIIAPPPTVKPAVPLEPSVRIAVGDPPRRLPHSQRSTAFDLVLVDGWAVCQRGNHSGLVESGYPRWLYGGRKGVGRPVANVGDGRGDGSVVGSTKGSSA